MASRILLTTFIRNNNPVTKNASRNKHSNRQVKRLFKQHPARARVMSRLNPSPVAAVADEDLQPPRLAAIVDNPDILVNGWTHPPSSDVQEIVKSYPFAIQRTANKPLGAVGFLPVYSEYKINNSKRTTIVRKLSGDIGYFCDELVRVLGPRTGITREDLKLRAGNTTVEIKGSYDNDIRLWLTSLGF